MVTRRRAVQCIPGLSGNVLHFGVEVVDGLVADGEVGHLRWVGLKGGENRLDDPAVVGREVGRWTTAGLHTRFD